MARQWPQFITRGLGDSEEDDAERIRRWRAYDTQMQAVIAAGGVHQDADGWWVDDESGELIGPDPELERPLTEAELRNARPFREVFPDLADSIDRDIRGRGRPKAENPKQSISIRLDRDVVDAFKSSGEGWQSRMNDALRKAVGL